MDAQAIVMTPVTTESNFMIGDWVLVSYDGSSFPGEVTAIVGSEAKINCMHKSTMDNFWRWPVHEDHIFYFLTDIVKKNLAP